MKNDLSMLNEKMKFAEIKNQKLREKVVNADSKQNGLIRLNISMDKFRLKEEIKC